MSRRLPTLIAVIIAAGLTLFFLGRIALRDLNEPLPPDPAITTPAVTVKKASPQRPTRTGRAPSAANLETSGV